MNCRAFILALVFAAGGLVQAQEPIVAGIRVSSEGAVPVDEPAVLSFISVKKGEPLSRFALSADVRALLESGRFSSVRVFADPAPDGVIVNYVVRAKPRIRYLRIEGADDVGNDKVREWLGLSPGDLIEEAALAGKAIEVREQYRKRYYPDARLSWKIREDPATGTADVIITVREGPRSKIRRIRFDGPVQDYGAIERAFRSVLPWFFEKPPVTGYDLRRVMKQRRAGLFSWLTGSGAYKPDELDEDLDAIRSALEERGYLDAQVGRPDIRPSGRRRIDIHIPVEPGRRYRLGRISVEGASRFSNEEIARTITNRPNDIASSLSLRSARQAVSDYYGSRGYLGHRVEVSLNPHKDEPIIDLRLRVVDEGRPARVRDVKIRGNTRTRDKVIRREVTVLPGDKYDQLRVRNSILRLRNLGYFERVDIAPVPTDDPDWYDLSIDVEERRTGQFVVGAGFSSVDRLIGFVEISQGNFDIGRWPPVGGGQKIRLRATAGEKRNDLELTFIEPWLFDRRLTLSLDAYRRNRSYLSRYYDQRETGGKIGFGVPVARATRLTLSYGLENINIHGVSEKAPPFIKEEAGEFLKSYASVTLGRDTRDSVFLPTRGQSASLTGTWAGGPLGGEVDVYSIEAQAATHHTLWWEHIINVRVWTEVVEGHGEDSRVPIFERQFLGGLRSLRGFRFRRVGPKDPESGEPVGGQTAWLGVAEYTIPVYEQLRLAVFYDIGYVYEDAFDWDLGRYNSDWGVGVRILIPFFPIRFDYTWPLERDPGDTRRSGRFTFMIGYGF